ncbi:hypothetical protein L3Q82_024141 [Scortum barcoo]|uniref:Uncharacterized protein n=1 Tax=Scortum barcoo TaxID=214431 RepID=A0ACB8WV32_9TELE|nr:hypothetical protein L3Q82_024141 [Scortum barcoo]
MVVRCREDQDAMNLLEKKTQRLEVEGVHHYAIPLLRKLGAPKLDSSTHSVMAHLRAVVKQLKREPEKATIYSAEINKLINAGQTTPSVHLEGHVLRRPARCVRMAVLPFGTTSSPCCAIFTLQQHACNHQDSHPEVQQSFYVDNCLKSFPTISTAKQSVDQLRTILAEGGFNLRQWASNQSTVVAHLPTDARSSATEQWLSQSHTDPLEPTLGLRWNCADFTLGYQYRIIEHSMLTMRTAYQVLANQYDPLGFMVPFTTHAKVLIWQLWSKQRGWDDPDLTPALREAWKTWESELKHLNSVSIPCCYAPLPTKAVEPNDNIPDATKYSSWKELVEATRQAHGVAATDPASLFIRKI